MRMQLSGLAGVAVAVAACGGTPGRPAISSTRDGLAVLASAPPDALVLMVHAIRWSCEVTDPRGVTSPDLRVPVGRAVELIVSTPESPRRTKGFAVSLVGTNVDKAIVKDSPAVIVFRIDKPGTYQWKCPTSVPPPRTGPVPPGTVGSPDAKLQRDPVRPLVALSTADYEAMLAATAADVPSDPVTFGRQLYDKKGCVACHAIDGSARIGPSWKGIWGTKARLSDGTKRLVDAGYVRESILHPRAFARPAYPSAMPSFQGQLQERELAALIAFIESLK